MKLLPAVIGAYRYLSSRTAIKSAKWTYSNKKKIMKGTKNIKRNRIRLTNEQLQVLDAISQGKSVFITGSAGTGKTFLLHHIIERLHKLHDKSEAFVTASTGLAACALAGQTLHSFAGVGLAEADRETLLQRVVSDRKAFRRWKIAQALVIDENSMVSAELFDTLEYIARQVRKEDDNSENKVWGGLQLVVSGDFFQLPPIVIKKNSKGKQFAFEADCWNSSFDMQVELTKSFRQSEAELVKSLQNIRKGECYPVDLQLLKKCCSETEPSPSAVQLFPMNKDVNRVNQKKMEKLEGPFFSYHALDLGEDPWKKQVRQGIAPDELILCKGARVMLVKNLNPWRKLVNGAVGTVMGFRRTGREGISEICEQQRVPYVKFDSGLRVIIYPETWAVKVGDTIVATRKQMPLQLAWALSIHKCQGLTLDSLHTDLSGAFTFGMVYVALSRVRSLDGLHLSGFDPSMIKAHPKVLQFYKRFSCGHDEEREDHNSCKDKTSSTNVIHVSNRTSYGKRSRTPIFFPYITPNLSLVSWVNRFTKKVQR